MRITHYFGCGVAGKHFSNQGTMQRRAEPGRNAGKTVLPRHAAVVFAVFYV